MKIKSIIKATALSLIINFSSVAFSADKLEDTIQCNINNYREFIKSEEKTDKLIAETNMTIQLFFLEALILTR